jgi:hypothetical protein
MRELKNINEKTIKSLSRQFFYLLIVEEEIELKNIKYKSLLYIVIKLISQHKLKRKSYRLIQFPHYTMRYAIYVMILNSNR